MIQCPSCNEQIADDSAHCGFCGHQLKGGASKTMFGMAPVTADDIDAIKQATEDAKAAAAVTKPTSPLPKPGLPKPAGSGEEAGPGASSAKPTLPKPGGLNIPRPSTSQVADPGTSPDQAKTEMMSPVSSSEPASPGGAQVAAPGAVGGDPSAEVNPPTGPTDPATPAMSSEDQAADTPTSGSPSAAPNMRTPMWGEQASSTEGASAPASDNSWGDPAPSGGLSSDSSWGDSGTVQPASDDSWGAGAAGAATATDPGPSSWGDSSMPTDSPNSPMVGGGGGGGFPAGDSKKDEQKKMIMYAAGGVFGLFFLCCVVSIILNILF